MDIATVERCALWRVEAWTWWATVLSWFPPWSGSSSTISVCKSFVRWPVQDIKQMLSVLQVWRHQGSSMFEINSSYKLWLWMKYLYGWIKMVTCTTVHLCSYFTMSVQHFSWIWWDMSSWMAHRMGMEWNVLQQLCIPLELSLNRVMIRSWIEGQRKTIHGIYIYIYMI